RYPGAIGLKTGYTRQAGHTFVGAARRDGRTMIAVVLNTDDTYGSAAALLDYGFATAPGSAGIGERIPEARVRPYEPPIETQLVQSGEKAVKGDAGSNWFSRLMLMVFASTGGVVVVRRRAEQRRRTRAERRRQVAEARRREFQRACDPEGWDSGCRVEVPRTYELL
ncbi:MAG: hypothetical protein ACRDZ3_23280, partial [Acidimicrobiia bacterium]